MMKTLLLDEGSLLNLKSTTLALGQFIKIQPQSPNFLSIHDPKAVLEMSLRNFSALTKGDIIEISYNNQIYEIAVLQVRAHGATDESTTICVVETDIEVDFATTLGYIELERTTAISNSASCQERRGYRGEGQNQNFKGFGIRLKDASKTKRKGKKDKRGGTMGSRNNSKGVIQID